jgi:hypothetical protein
VLRVVRAVSGYELHMLTECQASECGRMTVRTWRRGAPTLVEWRCPVCGSTLNMQGLCVVVRPEVRG